VGLRRDWDPFVGPGPRLPHLIALDQQAPWVLCKLAPVAAEIKCERSQIIFTSSYEHGFVRPAFEFCLIFKHGIKPISSISGLVFTLIVREGQVFQGVRDASCDLLKVQWREELEAF
jgi:hypothetical protein